LHIYTTLRMHVYVVIIKLEHRYGRTAPDVCIVRRQEKQLHITGEIIVISLLLLMTATDTSRELTWFRTFA
jgi:hypothetical protein